MLSPPKIPQTADARVDHFRLRRQCMVSYRRRGPTKQFCQLALDRWLRNHGQRSRGCGAISPNIQKGEGLMIKAGKMIAAGLMTAALALAAGAANAKDKVKV